MSDASGAAAAETLDLRGEVCPFTFVRVKLRLEELAPGARLRVLVDHEPATRNVPRSLSEWGQKVRSVTPDGDTGGWVIEVEKAAAERRADTRHDIPAEVQIFAGDDIVVLRARNLSLSGVCVEAPVDAPDLLLPGAHVELVVAHHGTAVRSPARVIRHHTPGAVGLVFSELAAENRELLRHMIVRASHASPKDSR